jgi:hypothetical protein
VLSPSQSYVPPFRGWLRAVLVGSETPEEALPIESVKCGWVGWGRRISLPSTGKDQGPRVKKHSGTVHAPFDVEQKGTADRMAWRGIGANRQGRGRLVEGLLGARQSSATGSSQAVSRERNVSNPPMTAERIWKGRIRGRRRLVRVFIR